MKLPLAPVLLDRRERPLRDLRLSVTDRCNFRCRYCMPREHFGAGHTFLPRSELLSFEELVRFAGIAVSLGVEKIRITGGEPLLRAELPRLVELLAKFRGVDLALTTNGALLPRLAAPLARAGLLRLTVSLDALDPNVFRAMTDSEFGVKDVLEGIRLAAEAGLRPIKINTVVRKGVNDGEIVPLARHFKGKGHSLRFIEYMDVGVTNGWKAEQVISGREIVERLSRELPLELVAPGYPGEVARRYRYLDGTGEIGIITSVSQPFCGDCSRMRLSSDGKLYTCLFGRNGRDVRALLRSSTNDAELAEFVRGIWSSRDDRYSEERSDATRRLPRAEMSYIGG